MPSDVVLTSSLSDADVRSAIARIDSRLDQMSAKNQVRSGKEQRTLRATIAGFASAYLGVNALVGGYKKLEAAAEDYERRNISVALSMRSLHIEQTRFNNALGRFAAHPIITQAKERLYSRFTEGLDAGYDLVYGFGSSARAERQERIDRRREQSDNAYAMWGPMQVEILKNVGLTFQAARQAADFRHVQNITELRRQLAGGQINTEQYHALMYQATDLNKSEHFAIERERFTAVPGGAPMSIAAAALGGTAVDAQQETAASVKELVRIANQYVTSVAPQMTYQKIETTLSP